jgi:hypothetical protein
VNCGVKLSFNKRPILGQFRRFGVTSIFGVKKMGTGGSSASSWLCTKQHGVTFHKTEITRKICELQIAVRLLSCNVLLLLLLLFVGSSRNILANVQMVYDPHTHTHPHTLNDSTVTYVGTHSTPTVFRGATPAPVWRKVSSGTSIQMAPQNHEFWYTCLN